MAETPMLMVFAYDIAEDRQRARVAKLLEDRLTRVQDSVFEGWLTDAAAKTLGDQLVLHLDEGDSLRIYAVAGNALSRCIIYDELPLAEPHDCWFV